MDDSGKLWTIVEVERTCGSYPNIFRFDGNIFKSAINLIIKLWTRRLKLSSMIRHIEGLEISADLLDISLKNMLETAKYLEQPDECFARAYAQFIAEESASNELKAELNEMLKTESAKVWETKDFAPIKKAIKETFARLRWMKL